MHYGLFLLRRKYADFDAPVESLIIRIVRIGRHIPAFSLDAEFVGIKFEFFDQGAPDRFRPSQAQLAHRLDRDTPFHARIGMPFNQNDGPGKLPGKTRHLFERGIDIRIVELSGDRISIFIPGRLIGIRRIRKEVDPDRLGQDRRFRRHFRKLDGVKAAMLSSF